MQQPGRRKWRWVSGWCGPLSGSWWCRGRRGDPGRPGGRAHEQNESSQLERNREESLLNIGFDNEWTSNTLIISFYAINNFWSHLKQSFVSLIRDLFLWDKLWTHRSQRRRCTVSGTFSGWGLVPPWVDRSCAGRWIFCWPGPPLGYPPHLSETKTGVNTWETSKTVQFLCVS